MSKDTTISKEDFIIRAIERLRTDKSNGIHAVYSGLNEAFKAHFGEESRKTTDTMVSTSKLESRPVKGGVMLYKAGEMPKDSAQKAKDAKVQKTLAVILRK